MPTFFDALRCSYVDIVVSQEGVPVEQFLDASEGLVKIFGTPLDIVLIVG
jgi:hypothetical protein